MKPARACGVRCRFASMRALLEAGGPILDLYLARRMRAGREDAERFGERQGIPSVPRPAGFLIWFHAASVGESMSMLRLLDRLLAERPDISILVTTGNGNLGPAWSLSG